MQAFCNKMLLCISSKMHFLQSQYWEAFQKSLSGKAWRIKGVLIIKCDLPFGKSWFYIPRPDKEQCRLLPSVLDEIKVIVKKENAIFLRTDPDILIFNLVALRRKQFSIFNLKFIKRNNQIQPKKTLILDLSKSKEQLLAQMRKKTRYSVRYAKKHGIKVRISNKKNKKQFKQDFGSFWQLLHQNARNNSFKIYSKNYYNQMLKMPIAQLFIAEKKNSVLSANIVIFFQQKAYGIHGANAFKMRNLRAAYLMQWERILEAKKRGCLFYDFWGIGHQWPGITEFKKGFGGKEVEYTGVYDFIFKPFSYKIYCGFKKLRKI